MWASCFSDAESDAAELAADPAEWGTTPATCQSSGEPDRPASAKARTALWTVRTSSAEPSHHWSTSGSDPPTFHPRPPKAPPPPLPCAPSAPFLGWGVSPASLPAPPACVPVGRRGAAVLARRAVGTPLPRPTFLVGGGGGIRTRVLRSRSRPSPSAAGGKLSGAALLPAAMPPRNQAQCPQCSVGVTH